MKNYGVWVVGLHSADEWRLAVLHNWGIFLERASAPPSLDCVLEIAEPRKPL